MLKSCPCKLQALHREIDGFYCGPAPRKFQSVRTDPRADLKNLLATPALKLREAWNVRLDKVFSRRDLLGPCARSDWRGSVRDIAGTRIPKLSDIFDGRHDISFSVIVRPKSSILLRRSLSSARVQAIRSSKVPFGPSC